MYGLVLVTGSSLAKVQDVASPLVFNASKLLNNLAKIERCSQTEAYLERPVTVYIETTRFGFGQVLLTVYDADLTSTMSFMYLRRCIVIFLFLTIMEICSTFHGVIGRTLQRCSILDGA